MQNYRLYVGHALDKGLKRSQNEDALALHYPDSWQDLNHLGALFIVADGVGGLDAGVLASDAAVRGLIQEYYHAEQNAKTSQEQIKQALHRVNHQIHSSYQNSATTIVAALIRGLELLVAHVGDSRAYLYQNQSIRQVTQDHVFPVTQADGRVKNKLLKALGYQPEIEPEIQSFGLMPSDRVILMSDGATRYLEDSLLAQLCRDYPQPHELAKAIVDVSNRSGGVDNISVIVIDIGEALLDEATLQAHLQIFQNRPETAPQTNTLPLPTAPQTMARNPQQGQKASPLRLLSLFLISAVILAGAYYGWQEITKANLSITTDLPSLEDSQPSTENSPLDAASPTEALPLELAVGVKIAFDESAASYLRIQTDLVAFVLEIGQAYEISEIYESRDGVTWYRLFDERNESYGWITENALPPYRFLP